MPARLKAAAVESRSLKMHENLLMDVMLRQAGSLAKAVLELVMNAIDAGGSRCQVTLRADRVVVEDDGRGMDRREIERFFEVFGQPHEEDERKVYGTFRMGRGQAFAFGANTWRTGRFEMAVDIKRHGSNYTLRSDRPPAAGCRVEIRLYERLAAEDLDDTVRTVGTWVRYAPGVVTINGNQVNVDPAGETWDHVTEEAYLRLTDRNGLVVYNLGVHTMELAGYRFGVGGVVVSRKQLKVNFARNDIMGDCPVWKKIRPLVDRRGRERATRRPTLSDAARARMVDLVRRGETPEGARDLKLFQAVTGRFFSAREVRGWKYHNRLTACPVGTPVGDVLFQQRIAFVLADATLEAFETDLAGLAKVVARLDPAHNPPEVVAFESLAAGLDRDYVLVPEDQWSAAERIWLQLAGNAFGAFVVDRDPDTDRRTVDRPPRRVLLGRSDAADGWTDGSTHVVIDRKWLAGLKFDAAGFCRLGALMLHEYCHTEPDTAAHVHGPEFYEDYHDRSFHLGEFVRRCQYQLTFALRAAGQRVTKEHKADRYKASRARRALLTALPDEDDGD